MRMCFASVLTAVLALPACGGSSEEAAQPPPGVSFLDYSPKPFHKGTEEMTVRFTTTGPAGDEIHTGEYRVVVTTGKDGRDKSCYPDFGSEDAVPGETGKTYVLQIPMVYESHHEEQGPGYPCAGPAQIRVETSKYLGSHQVRRTLSFRVLPPKPGSALG